MYDTGVATLVSLASSFIYPIPGYYVAVYALPVDFPVLRHLNRFYLVALILNIALIGGAVYLLLRILRRARAI
jgi:hypothetical protein